MSDYSELKRLADYYTRLNGETWYAEESKALDSIPCFSAEWFIAAASPAAVLELIAENERLAANVKLNLCDYPAIHRGDVDLLVSFISGTSQTALAELHQCTPPNISRKIRRVKARLGWKDGMGPREIHVRAEQLRALASQGAVVTADVMAERDQLKAENEALRATASLSQLLPDLDDALEDLEAHGRHGDQGYRKLKDWYRKVALACAAIDAAMSKEAQS